MTGNRTPRGTNSVSGMGGVTKVYKRNSKGVRYLAGYRAKFKPKGMSKYPAGNTPMFKANQLEQARAWVRNEVAAYTRAMELGKPYVPFREREQLDRIRNITVAEYSAQYLANYRSRITGKEVGSSTMATKRYAHGFIQRFFGSMPLRDVTSKACEQLGDQLADHVTTQRRVLKELKAMLRKAATATDDMPALIPRNPMDVVVIPAEPESEQAKIPTATPDELERLYEAMPAYTRISIKLGAWCGLRIAEVCALQVQDVDLKHRLLRVRHGLEHVDGVLRLKAPKNEASDNTVNIPDSLVPLLREHIRLHTDGEPDSMLLKPERANIMDENTLGNQFRKARVKAGRPDLHFHTLRATYDDAVSRVAQNAADYMASTRRHDVQTGVKHYQRSKADAQRAITTAVDSALTGTVSEPSVPQTGVEQLERDNKELLERLAQLEQANQQLQEQLAALAG